MWDNIEADRKETKRKNVERIDVEHNTDDNRLVNKGIGLHYGEICFHKLSD